MLFLLGRGGEYWVIKVGFVAIVDRVPGRGLSSPLISQGCPRGESAAALGVFCPPALHGLPAVGSSAVPCPVPPSSPTALVPLPLKRNRVGAETSVGLFASCVSPSRRRPFPPEHVARGDVAAPHCGADGMYRGVRRGVRATEGNCHRLFMCSLIHGPVGVSALGRDLPGKPESPPWWEIPGPRRLRTVVVPAHGGYRWRRP